MLRRIENLEPGGAPRTSAAGRSSGPRCSRAARGGCRRRPDTPARRRSRPDRAGPDDERQVLDADRDTGSRRRRRSCTARGPFRYRCSPSLVSRRPASSASCVCRISVFGLSSLPAPHAGQFTWQRPHSTQVNASSTVLLPRSFTVSRPTCSFSKSRFGTFAELGRLEEHGDRRQHQVEVLRGGNQREKREDDEHMDPPVDAARRRRFVEPPGEQERHHQRRDEQPDHDRFDRYVVAEPDGPDERPPDRAGRRCRRGRRRQTASAPSCRHRTSRVPVRSTMPRPLRNSIAV